MADFILPSDVSTWINHLACVLHADVAWRLQPLFIGMLFAQGRRTVSSWLRAGGLTKEYEDYYYFLTSLGRKTKSCFGLLLGAVLRVVAPSDRLVFAIDDTPTKRYGPFVQGAGLHHNPTPGPADQKFLYGHIWVTLSMVVRHALWGTIGLPLLACLYVRQRDIAKIPAHYGISFETKLSQAAGLVEWLMFFLGNRSQPIWVVVDGAYAKKPFLERASQAKAIVVSRLRKDAALWSVPESTGGQRRRGRPRKYGADRLSLAKRAGHPQGWQSGTFRLYNHEKSVRYKTFLATYKPAGGVIRVVLVREEDSSWRAYFCTKAEATPAEILEAAADRAAIEQNFHDLKEVHGAGQQQVRNYWSNIAVWHMNMWMHTILELWAWNRPHGELVDRSASPWDDAERRPSHADRRNALRRSCLQQEFQREADRAGLDEKSRRRWLRLLGLAA